MAHRHLAMAAAFALDAALALANAPARAATHADADEQALALADALAPDATHARSWRGHAELAWGRTDAGPSTSQGIARGQASRRASLALHGDGQAAPGWRWAVAGRLDADDPPQAARAGEHLTLSVQEALLGWQPAPGRSVEFGRIRVQPGLASGYSPVDFLRAGTLRSSVTLDPVSRKTHRLGQVMLRGQWLWDGGALAALCSPRLATRPSTAAFSADLGATNDRHRLLVSLSPQAGGGLQPQWLVLAEQGQPVQAALSLSAVPGQAQVLHLEMAVGRGRDQLARALGEPAVHRTHTRLTAGGSHTAANRLTLTLEASLNTAAPDAAGWRAVQQGHPQRYAAYRAWVAHAQELPTRRLLMLLARWPDALAPRLDLSALVQHDPDDHSRLAWLEARWRLDRADVSVQGQWPHGHRGSVFGAPATARGWAVAARLYF